MGLNLSDSAKAYDELKNHIGHKIVCVGYGVQGDVPQNIALECEDCGEVLVDFDRIERDSKGFCIYCGQECWKGDMCDEQQAGGFNS